MQEVRQTDDAAVEHFTERRWYLLLARILSPFLLGTGALLIFGAPDWPLVREIPQDWIAAVFSVCALIYAPRVIYVFRIQKERNLEKYNPDSPKVRRAIRRLRKIGWIFAFLGGLTFFSLIALGEAAPQLLESERLIFIIAGVLIFCLFVSLGAFRYISDIKSGTLTPLKWLMRSADSEKDVD